MFPHLGYIEYCDRNNLFVELKNLNDHTEYFWHSNWESKVIPVKFVRVNGNTFIFQITDTNNKIALSSENELIYGLSYEKGYNLFEHWRYS